jgi:virginiamycin B lyase
MTDDSIFLAAGSGVASRRRLWILLALAVVLALAAGGTWVLLGERPLKVVEHKMLAANDIPTALAVATDGAVWFSIDFSDAVGVVRNGKIQRIEKGGRNVDALGLGVDASGNAWYADAPAIAILRISPEGEVKSYPLGTPIARLGRLAVAPDGAVWFAESTAYSVTRLKDGELTRHVTRSLRSGPYGVAVAKDGTVWATLQGANQIMRIAAGGEVSEFDVPTRSASPTDVAVDASGAVWFLEFRANKIGRLENGKITEFDAPLEGAGLSGLGLAPDGSVWFGMVRSHALGRLRNGEAKVFRLPRADARPFSVAADAKGNIWYTDIGGYVGMIPADEAK